MKQCLLILFLLISSIAKSQNKIFIYGSDGDFYIYHQIASRETLFSLSKSYNTAVEDIARYNSLKQGETINVGQLLKIPLHNGNFTQDGQKEFSQILLPVFYRTTHNSSFLMLSNQFNQVKESFIREWNNLSRDEIRGGMDIIVGHLKIDKDKSREVLGGAVAYTLTQQNNSQTASDLVISAHNVAKKELPQSPLTPEQEGFFLKEFSQQIKQKTVELQSGEVASFKTTSGWTDRKYYALFSGVAPGTVIKITAENGRSIYAKVLDALPNIKENAGLILRISNAAAATLFGDAEGKYRVEVRFAP